MGTDIIDVVINSTLQKMEEFGIFADINVEFPKNINIILNDIIIWTMP